MKKSPVKIAFDFLKNIVVKEWFIVVALTLVAAFLRFWMLKQSPAGLYSDEAVNGNDALFAWRSWHFLIFYPANNGREGMFINLQSLAMAALGAHTWVLRSVSAFFGTLTVPGVYLLIRELFSDLNRKDNVTAKRLAFLTAFLTAIGIWQIVLSRLGLRAISSPFFLCWSLYLLVAALNRLTAEPKLASHAKWFALAGGLVYGLGFHTYIAYRVTPIIVVAVIWLYRRAETGHHSAPRRGLWPATGLFAAGAFVAAAPLVWHFLNHPSDLSAHTNELSIFSSTNPWLYLAANIGRTILMFNVIGDPNWRHNIGGRPELFWPIGLLFLIGIVFGIAAIRRASEDKTVKAAWTTLLISLPVTGIAWLLFQDKASGETPWQALAVLLVVTICVMTALTRDHAESAVAGFDRPALRRASIILFTWLMVSIAPMIFTDEGIPHSLRAILAAPAVYALAALGCVVITAGFTASLEHDRSRRYLPHVAAIVLLLLVAQSYHAYFTTWAKDARASTAYMADITVLSDRLNELPDDLPKYIIVDPRFGSKNDRTAMIQPIMFLTDTYTPDRQRAKNMHYVEGDASYPTPQNAAKVILRAKDPKADAANAGVN